MREIDRIEGIEQSGLEPFEALTRSVALSTVTVTADIDGSPEMIFGVGPADGSLLSRSGRVWLVATDAAVPHARAFTRHARPFVARMLALYPHMANVVHNDNAVAIRWLRWCGFTMDEPKPMGRSGALYRRFEIRASDV